MVLIQLQNYFLCSHIFCCCLDGESFVNGCRATQPGQAHTPDTLLQIIAFIRHFIGTVAIHFENSVNSLQKNFTHRVFHLTTEMIAHLSDYWALFKLKCEQDNVETTQTSLMRVQVEIDQVILVTTLQMMQSKLSGELWQGISELAFGCVSLQMAWQLLAVFITRNYEHFLGACPEGAYVHMMLDNNRRERFSDYIMCCSLIEGTFMLTALANLAKLRIVTKSGITDEHEAAFVIAVCSELSYVAFMCTRTYSTWLRPCRDFISMVAEVHPFVISSIVNSVQRHLKIIGKVCFLVSRIYDVCTCIVFFKYIYTIN